MTYHAISVPLVLGAVMTATSPGRAQPPSPLDSYRNLKYPPTKENFNKGWQERILVEFEVVNSASLDALRRGLKDKDPFVRSIAARALGVRGDKDSADALAALVKTDPEAMVRVRAVEALGLLKLKPEAIELAHKDSSDGVRWVARIAAGQVKADTDARELMQKAYAAGIKKDQLGVAKVGQTAPDFTAHTSDGKPFKLSTVLGKKPILLYFTGFDG